MPPGNVLVLTNLALSQAGGYVVVASNLFGSVTSSVAQLDIIEDFNLPGKVATNCTDKPSGLVAWWPGDGFSFDIAGTNHGTLQNGTWFSSGKSGHASSCDGTDDRVFIPESPPVDLSKTPSWTIEAWVNPASFANGYPTIYSEGYWGASLGLRSGSGVPESWINNGNRLI